jgi:hypothetical protein
LKARFEKNVNRHKGLEWAKLKARLDSPANGEKLWSLNEMEKTGGEPENSAVDMAASMGIELLTEEQYRELQRLGNFDLKTSSWVKTPGEIRKLGGALFCDRRYNHVFLYHNGAESYYAVRGFRGTLRV